MADIAIFTPEGDTADPNAVKQMENCMEGYVKVIHQLRPIGVVMAGPGIKADD